MASRSAVRGKRFSRSVADLTDLRRDSLFEVLFRPQLGRLLFRLLRLLPYRAVI
jgi:hypothetical protein